MEKHIDEQEKKILLELARKTIEKGSKDNIITEEEVKNLSDILKEKRGCFVTITINNQLRGCIGYILPIQPLYQAVIDNAYNCAYSDPRFPAVTKDEIEKLHIEISVLSVPVKLIYKDKDDLLNKLTPNKDGVIIKEGFRSATFLPQVWEQLPEKEDFLGHLCLKAGFKADKWTRANLEVETYFAKIIEE